LKNGEDFLELRFCLKDLRVGFVGDDFFDFLFVIEGRCKEGCFEILKGLIQSRGGSDAGWIGVYLVSKVFGDGLERMFLKLIKPPFVLFFLTDEASA
jgi:hypothetical protein